jgi:hypothetical protein
MPGFFIEFEILDPTRFDQLAAVFEALKRDKESGRFRADDAWPALFDAQALASFRDYGNDHAEAWDLPALIEAFENGEYHLLACTRLSPEHGRLEYDPFAGPFGGTECMHALIEAFGFRVTRDSWHEP